MGCAELAASIAHNNISSKFPVGRPVSFAQTPLLRGKQCVSCEMSLVCPFFCGRDCAHSRDEALFIRWQVVMAVLPPSFASGRHQTICTKSSRPRGGAGLPADGYKPHNTAPDGGTSSRAARACACVPRYMWCASSTLMRRGTNAVSPLITRTGKALRGSGRRCGSFYGFSVRPSTKRSIRGQ